jgi:ectoine hydroxylase-related dioxygenase (phytanoyl-CoA dioxygenase family)
MPSVAAFAPRSGGKNLDIESHAFSFLKASSLSMAAEQLRNQMQKDGYLYIKEFFPRSEVLDVRKEIIARMRELNLIFPKANPLEAKANPDQRTVFMPELAKQNSALDQLLYGDRVMSFYALLLGGPVRHYDFTWFRPVGPGRGTAPHCDLVYMGRGTRQVFTMWVPFGDVPLELGGLMILEGSHRKSEQLKNYLSRDVDSYCTNRPGADQAKVTDSLLWDGKLAKDPVSLRQKLGDRWLTARFRAGDMLTFGMTLVHASLDNQTDEIRFSSDSRYQLASEPADGRWIGADPAGHTRAGKQGRIC